MILGFSQDEPVLECKNSGSVPWLALLEINADCDFSSAPGSTPIALSPEGPDELTWFLVWLCCGLSELLAGSRCGPLLFHRCYKEAILYTWAVTVSTPLTAML